MLPLTADRRRFRRVLLYSPAAPPSDRHLEPLDNAFTEEDLLNFDRRVRERLETDKVIEYVAETKLDVFTA